jgi:hypothetical protein
MTAKGATRSFAAVVADREIAELSHGEKTVWGASERVRGASHARTKHRGRSPWRQRDGLKGMTNSPKRRSQAFRRGRRPTAILGSHNRPTEGVSRGARFARFAAAMEADAASQDQLVPRSQRRNRPADPVNSSPRIQWLGIGSWALFCAALFVSLLIRSDRVSFQLDQIHPQALVSDVRPMADSMPTTRRLLPAHGQEVASTAPATAPDLDARPADQGTRARLEALISRKPGRRAAFSNACLRLATFSEVSRSRRDRIRRSGDCQENQPRVSRQ